MKGRWGIAIVFAVTASVTCAEESALSKDEARELALEGLLETDVCASNEWYEDGECDEFCAEVDPDCVDEEAGVVDEDAVGTDEPTDAGPTEAETAAGGGVVTGTESEDAGIEDAGIEDADIEDAGIEDAGAVSLACTTNTDCAEGFFCRLGDATTLDSPGLCVAVPEACAQLYAPVCGADGATYDNECFAHQFGVNVVATTSCEKAQADDPCGGPDDLPCAEGQYCDQGGSTLPIDGEGCINVGMCKESPAQCPELHAPVCGCDGVTYLNMCIAWQGGTDIAFYGECDAPVE